MSGRNLANLVQLMADFALQTSGSWVDRKAAFMAEVKAQNAETAIEEFLGWFNGELP